MLVVGDMIVELGPEYLRQAVVVAQVHRGQQERLVKLAMGAQENLLDLM
jgi:hypothetical protein